MSILLFVMLIILSIIIISISIINIRYDWSILVFIVGFMFGIISILIAMLRPISSNIEELQWCNVIEGKHAIYVESDIGDYTLTEMKDRNILQSKKICVIVKKNIFGKILYKKLIY